ncbi:MAG: 3-phosphoserine/phosphohydroxythreonine transaminase, partial [Gemmatimonadales bacterium]
MPDRIHNFSAGPAVLPEPVLRKAQEAIWNVAGSGIGIMEHSHRGKVFDRIINEAEQACRDLAGIPDNYRVLFLQGGASLQFSMIPMNLLPADRTADYLLTGVWSQKAVKEAKQVGKVHIAATSEATNFDRIPKPDEIRYSADPAYVHFTTNNTIYGTQWVSEPSGPAGAPLIADTSSDMYSRPIDVRKYGLIYAGAQKNLGPSGVVLVIMRDDLIERGPKTLPTMLQYRTHAAEKSLYNTAPTFGIF